MEEDLEAAPVTAAFEETSTDTPGVACQGDNDVHVDVDVDMDLQLQIVERLVDDPAAATTSSRRSKKKKDTKKEQWQKNPVAATACPTNSEDQQMSSPPSKTTGVVVPSTFVGQGLEDSATSDTKGTSSHHGPLAIATGLPVANTNSSSNTNLFAATNNNKADVTQQQPTRLFRERHVQRRTADPGAIAIRGPDGSTLWELEDDNDEEVDPSNDNDGLVVANMVTEDSGFLRLPGAIPADESAEMDASQRKRDESNKKIRTYMLLGAILLIVVIMIAVTFTVTVRKDSLTTTTTMPADSVSTGKAPSVNPTPAPTDLTSHVLSLLPLETTRKITEEPDSPQAQAWEWLLDDIDRLSSHKPISTDRIIQRFALAVLYFASEGSQWTTNSGWLNHSMHECDWFTQSSFSLRDKKARFIPGYYKELANLSNAPFCHNETSTGLYKHLWLDQNNLVGTIPEELYLLTMLETLSMGRNRLKGTLSTRVGQLTRLQGLALTGRTSGGSIPSEIGLLANLKALGLNTNEHEGEIPSALWSLTNLQTLNIGSNPNMQGTIASEVGRLTSLRWLSMDGCQYSGSLPTEIGNLEHLEWLTLLNNRFSGQLPSELGRHLNMSLFSLSHNRFTGTIPTQLGLLTVAKILAIQDNKLTGEVPSEFGNLASVSSLRLNLANNHLTGTLAKELGLMKHLQELELVDNELSGRIPSEFGQLTSMGQLLLQNNSLTGTVPMELSVLQQSLFRLQLEGNPGLSGVVPDPLCSLNGTCVGNSLIPCEGPYGLFFDCGSDSSLCGCDCPCG